MEEIDELKLKTARLALEREELALAREKELLIERERRQGMLKTARSGTARAAGAAVDIGGRTGKAVLGYTGRLLVLLLLWGIGVLAVSVYFYSKKVPTGVVVDFGYVAGYVLAASAYYAPWMCLLAAFFRVQGESLGALFVLCGALIFGINHYADPSELPVAAPFNEHIRPSLLAFAQAPGLTAAERGRRYGLYFEGRCSDRSSPQAQRSAFDQELYLVESRFPTLNPDHSEFRPQLESQVVNRLQEYQSGGNTPCSSLRLAVDEIMLGLNMR